MIGAYAIASYPIAGALGLRTFTDKFYSSYFSTLSERSADLGELEQWSTIDVNEVDVPVITSYMEVSVQVGWLTPGFSWVGGAIPWNGGVGIEIEHISEFRSFHRFDSGMSSTMASTASTGPSGAMEVARKQSVMSIETYSPFLNEYVEQ